MKHNKTNSEPELAPVHFEFTHPTARIVFIAGTFNDWEPDAKRMHSFEEGRWLKDTALPLGSYEYCFVVDGQWMPDPLARESVPNPFGGRNSVLRVATPDAAHRADAQSLPLENAYQQMTQNYEQTNSNNR